MAKRSEFYFILKVPHFEIFSIKQKQINKRKDYKIYKDKLISAQKKKKAIYIIIGV